MSRTAGFSPIFITAAVSIFALITVGVWQIGSALHQRGLATSYTANEQVESTDAGAEATPSFAPGETAIGSAVLDGIVAKYISLKEQGLYTPEVGEKTAEKMAETFETPISFRAYTSADIQTSADTSYERMLTYRHDLQISLAPLLKNLQPEYEVFAYYLSTHDKKYLDQLQSAAQNYRAAAEASARVVPPKDAVTFHLGVLNSLGQFAATLDSLIANADDPFAGAVLLRDYNQGEVDVLTSFAALAKYYREKKS